ncbi:MAG: hypothetical protein ACTSQ8_26440 [Candidatus Helarchaeota archaeon]
MSSEKILAAIKALSSKIKSNEIEIYNEFSVQHELGILLRAEFSSEMMVQFERNISFFGLSKQDYEKKEIDIVIYSKDRARKHAIELKFPRNGQYPERMFKSFKDVKFLEQLVDAGFNQCFFIFFSDDPRFYKLGTLDGIYAPFRHGKILHGEVIKPTGKRDKRFTIKGKYIFKWIPIVDDFKYSQVIVG